MCAWATANGETFDTTLGGFSSNQTPNIMNNGGVAIWIVVVSVIILSSFAVVFVIRKKTS